jgi:hypothetical protein
VTTPADTPDLRSLALRAIAGVDWELRGARADKIVGAVLSAVGPELIRQGREEAAQAIAAYTDRWYPADETSDGQRARRKALRTAALIAAPDPTAQDVAGMLRGMAARVPTTEDGSTDD